MKRRFNYLLLSSIALSACGEGFQGQIGDGQTSDETAIVSVALTSVPQGVRCVRATLVSFGKTREVSADSLPGESVSLEINGLLPGSATLNMTAYDVPCAQATSTMQPTWLSHETEMQVQGGTQTLPDVTLFRAATVHVTADFDDETGLGGAGGSGGGPGGAGGGISVAGSGGAGGGSAGVSEATFGLIARWRFDEGMGSSLSDSSGNGNVATSTIGSSPMAPDMPIPAIFAASSGGSAIVLDNQRAVHVPNSPSIDSTGLNNAFTISAWVKASTHTARASIVSRAEVGTDESQFELFLSNGRPAARVHFFEAVGEQSIPDDDKFHHLVARYDGVTLSVFLDGALSTLIDIGWPVAADTTDTYIGAREIPGALVDFFTGAIDDVRLFNQSLTDAQLVLMP